MALLRRVVLCTYASAYSDIVLAELLNTSQIEVVGVVSSTRVLSKTSSKWRAGVRQIQLSGLSYAAYLFAVTSGYQLVRAVLGKGNFKQKLARRQIPVLETTDINADESIDFLRKLQPDILLSAHFNQLLKPEVLNLPQLACLNIHPSLLPAYKGVDPAFYALLRLARVTGTTVHLQDEQFDHGAILEHSTLTIRPQDSLFSLNIKLFKLGAVMAVRQILSFSAETQGTTQVGKGRYDSWPNPYDSKLFRQQRRYLRWKEYLTFVRYT